MALINTFPNSFLSEWKTIFGNNDSEATLKEIQQRCIGGYLRGSRLRSVFWRIFLKILPYHDRKEWIKIIADYRANYDQLKESLMVDPRESCNSPSINNPLSQQCESEWKQYFDDQKLRELVDIDVKRTLPELEFFQTSEIQSVLSNILFCYAKSNPRMSYRQGMHELAAPLIFVIYSDQQSYIHFKKELTQDATNAISAINDTDWEILDSLNSVSHMEHDSYSLFSKLMDYLNDIYLPVEYQMETQDDEAPTTGEQENRIELKTLDIGSAPFESEFREDTARSAVSARIKYIHDVILKENDPLLYNQLNLLDIQPTSYGIRWLRLLYGRELPLSDQLYLWDVLFLEELVLIDYVFVALLISIRHLILESDYTTCLHYLMHYPPVQDMQIIIQLAFSIKAQTMHPTPRGLNFDSAACIQPISDSHEDKNVNSKHMVKAHRRSDSSQSKKGIFNERHFNFLNSMTSRQGVQEKQGWIKPFRRQTFSGGNNLEKAPNCLAPKDLNATGRFSFEDERIQGKELERSPSKSDVIELMKQQLSILQSRVNDMDISGHLITRKINVFAQQIASQPEWDIIPDLQREQLVNTLTGISNELLRSITFDSVSGESEGTKIRSKSGSGQRKQQHPCQATFEGTSTNANEQP